KVVCILVSHVSGERHVPPVLDRVLEQRDGRKAVQNDGSAVEPLPKDRARVFVRSAVVDDDRETGLLRKSELVDEQLRLRIAGGVGTVVVEADLSERDDLRVLQQRRELVEVEARRRLVR